MKHFIPGEEIHRGFLRGGEWVKYEEDSKDIKSLYDAAIAIVPVIFCVFYTSVRAWIVMICESLLVQMLDILI